MISAQLVDVELTEPGLLDQDGVVAVEVVDGEERRRLVLDQGLLGRGVRHDDHQQVVVHLPGLGVDRRLVRACGRAGSPCPWVRSAPCTSVGRPTRCRARPRAATCRSRRRRRVWRAGSCRQGHPSTGPRPVAASEADAAGPVGGGHLLASRRPCTSPRRTGHGAGADVDGVLADLDLARRESGVVRLERDRPDLEPLAVVGRPGARAPGCRPGSCRSIAGGGVATSRCGRPSTMILGAKLTPVLRLRRGPPASPSAMPSRVATSRPAPPSASRASRSPAVSSGRIRSVITPNVGPASSSLTIRNVVAPVTSSPGPDGVLHRRGAPPGRQAARSAG